MLLENRVSRGLPVIGIVSEPYGVHALLAMKNVAKKIETFEIRSDDIWTVHNNYLVL